MAAGITLLGNMSPKIQRHLKVVIRDDVVQVMNLGPYIGKGSRKYLLSNIRPDTIKQYNNAFFGSYTISFITADNGEKRITWDSEAKAKEFSDVLMHRLRQRKFVD